MLTEQVDWWCENVTVVVLLQQTNLADPSGQPE